MSSRTTGGTLAAWLIIGAIVGFAGGAFFGLQSEGNAEPRTQTTESPSGTGDDSQSSSDETGDGTDDPGDTGDPTTPEDTPPTSDFTIDFSMSPSQVVAGEKGTINFEGAIEPAEEGVVLRLERKVGDGEWETFSENVGPYVTNADGQVSSSIWSGREGENHFRLVDNEDDSVVSNEVTVTITKG